MNSKRKSSSAGSGTPSGSPGPVLLFYPYCQGPDARQYMHHTPQAQTSHVSSESVSRYLVDSTSSRARDLHPPSVTLRKTYQDRSTVSDSGGLNADRGSNHTSHSLTGLKRQHSPELAGTYLSDSVAEQSAGPSNAPRLLRGKEKDKRKDAELQRTYRADRNERLRKLNSMLPKGLQCDREPPRLPPIVDGTIKYIEQLQSEKEQLQEANHNLTFCLEQSYAANNHLRSQAISASSSLNQQVSEFLEQPFNHDQGEWSLGSSIYQAERP
ncbi:hypothetical protein DENSPDRAFT_842154 [Dentipellis sp. KUC8613]|nr:hypothetical protein DENSPDRAFT_842154 [Dentipellis sp. KUC8613]